MQGKHCTTCATSKLETLFKHISGNQDAQKACKHTQLVPDARDLPMDKHDVHTGLQQRVHAAYRKVICVRGYSSVSNCTSIDIQLP